MDATNDIRLEWEPTGKPGTVTVRARDGDTLLDTDTFNVSKSSARQRYIVRFVQKCPVYDTRQGRENLERELLSIDETLAKAQAKPQAGADADAAELDVSRIMRPELFHSADVSGVAIPTPVLVGEEPKGVWRLYLRWHTDSKREQCELVPRIELPDGAALWLHPLPSEPLPTMQMGWTAPARKAWLGGADAPDPADVFKRICERLAHFLDFSGETAAGNTATLALWGLLTYSYPAWRSVPYLSIGGPLASGKSLVLDILERLAFRPVRSSNMTAPCLFRTLNDTGGTLLLDEAERLRDNTPDAGELRSILLSGYKVGSPARRLDKVGDGFQPVAFNVFGLKAIAGIARLPEALASRCIRLTMFRAGPDSIKPGRHIDADPTIWAELRDALHALTLEHGRVWLELAERTDVCPAMSGRERELWQPLLALATWLEDAGADGLLALAREHAEQTIELSREDTTPDADETLLRLLAKAVVNGTSHTMRPKVLLEQAKESDPETFRRWMPRGVSAVLKRYQLKTQKDHAGHRVYSKVTVGALRRVERAYGVKLGLPSENVPHVPHVPHVPSGETVGTAET